MQEPQKKPVTYEPLSLLEGLTAAYQQGSTIKFTANELGLLEALDSPNPEVSTAASFKTHELGEKLTEILVKDECFPGDSVRIIRNYGGGIGFYPNFASTPLVLRALQTGSPMAAIEWLQKVLATTAASGKMIHALWGVSVDREIQLTPDVKIVPMDELPDSVQKQ